MTFMNEYDVQSAVSRFRSNIYVTPRRYAVALTVEALAEWTNSHSDGWPYWRKPQQAAQKAIALVHGYTMAERDALESVDCTEAERDALESVDCTEAEQKAAYAVIKSFLTRQGVEHSEVIRYVTLQEA